MTDELATWRLDVTEANHTLVFSSINNALPVVSYSGPQLPTDERLNDFARADLRPIAPGTLDQIAPLSLLPEEGRGFQGYCGVQLVDDSGRPALTQFRLTRIDQTEHSIRFQATDNALQLALELEFQCENDSGVLITESKVTNLGDTRWRLDWLSVPVLPVDQSFAVLQEYRGRWTQEFTPVITTLRTGVHLRESRRARTGHDHFPGLIVGEAPLAWTRGRCAAMHYAYSDVHRVAIEGLPDGRYQVQAGIAESRTLAANSSQPSAEQSSLHSGQAYWTFSSNGKNELSHHFQRYVQDHVVKLPDPTMPRVVNYNCWEAIYFKHNMTQLKALATSAKDVGAERFVLDDGWFGVEGIPRNDDTSSLGDWFVDANKYPDGLTPLIDHVNSLGMQFGLWFEPEMVNLRSQLAQENPEWVLRHGDVEHVEGRSQYLLDFTNPDVVDYVYHCLHDLLKDHNIQYIKWDMNRDATRAVDAKGRRSLVRHSDAVQTLMARIRAAHPKVEIESCASGGGRIDYRVLKNTHRVWLSDSIDARVRWKMQCEAFVFLPPSVYGSHVGAEQAHTSARKQTMSFRALVAMTGHMGIESDMALLSDADRTTLIHYINLYKRHRDWMHTGRQYRLDTNNDDSLAQQFTSNDRNQFLLFTANLDVPVNETTAPVRLCGLDPHVDYEVSLINKDDIDPLATRLFDHPIVTQASYVMTGFQLMHQGIVAPFPMPDSMFLFHGTAVSAI